MIPWVREALPRVLPADWREVKRGEDGTSYAGQDGRGLFVIVSGAVEQDEKRWLHLSVSASDGNGGRRLPSWEEMREVKDLFLGRDTYAVQVMPPARFYVNICAAALHLFSCVDGHPLPEFSRGSGSL